MQAIHSFTIKATSIVAGDFPPNIVHNSSDEKYFTEETEIMTAERISIKEDHSNGTYITARMNDGAIAFEGHVKTNEPFIYNRLPLYNGELVRVVIENANGKTSHIVGRPMENLMPSVPKSA